ncbi:related to Ribosomal RNA-processing protein 15 [Zygosaccharomyces bailii]|nr:related to Ribosomal RNA-processing protein 15 [Zygosaccharomyces bailii]
MGSKRTASEDVANGVKYIHNAEKKHNKEIDADSPSDGSGEVNEDSSSDSHEEAEQKEDEETSEEEDIPRKKKSKNSKHDDGSAGFSNAMSAILSSHLKAYDRNDPIMARNKKVLRQNESDRLERQAKRALLAEKKKKLNRIRKQDIIPKVSSDADLKSGEEIRKVIEKEARLKKIARKGAVKLFNAILSTQINTEKDVNSNLADVGKQEKKHLLTDISKEKFLDMVKAAGDEE